MNIKRLAGQAVVGTVLLWPLGMQAQHSYQYEHAKHVQEEHDARHHTKAKVVGGSAVGGAVVGGLMGGGKGAVIGAGVGAGGGLVANHVRKQNDIKKRERCENEGRCR
ncbi:MAG TPA: hypothetical protein VFA99_00455 [Acidobacteriaceae bacterium]|nr:hypothetical protein [Acidobacteriaceae bacterium]